MKNEIQRLKNELRILYKLDDIRDSSFNSHELVERSLSLAKDELDVDYGFAVLYGDEFGEFDVISESKKLADSQRNELFQMSKAALSFNKIQQLKHSILNYCIVVPLLHKQVPLGAFVFSRKKNAPFDYEILKALISQVDSAIAHLKEAERAQQNSRELEVLYRIDMIRDSVKDFNELLNRILDEILQVIEGDSGYIMLFDGENLNLTVNKVSGKSEFISRHKRVIQKYSEQTVDVGKMQNLRNLSRDIKSLLTIPLVLNKKIIGVFGVANCRHGYFNKYDERLLNAIASQADTAIFETLEQRKIKEVFKRYVAEDVVEAMLEQQTDFLSGTKLYMTVSFADIRGFTSLSEKLEPEDLVDTINQFLGAMTEVVMAHKGTLDKFVGDEVISLFGAPIHYEDHAKRAIETSIDMQKAMKKLRRNWTSPLKKELGIGIGINTGWMVAGNIGCEKMTDYTVLGNDVNVCARLCGQAGPHEIIVSDVTYSKVKDMFKFEKLYPVKLKGKEHPVQIYKVLY